MQTRRKSVKVDTAGDSRFKKVNLLILHYHYILIDYLELRLKHVTNGAAAVQALLLSLPALDRCNAALKGGFGTQGAAPNLRGCATTTICGILGSLD